jgi:hypothetical protein
MKNTIIFSVILALSSFGSYSCSLASALLTKQSEMRTYNKIINSADIIHLDGSVIVEKSFGYQVKWNAVGISPLQSEKNAYIQKSLVGGINKSKSNKHIVTLIPLHVLRDVKNPVEKIELVTVNKKPLKYILFSPGNNSNEAIKIAKKRFGNSKLFSTQLHPESPILFIDAGIIKPNDSVRIEYEIKTVGEIKVN